MVTAQSVAAFPPPPLSATPTTTSNAPRRSPPPSAVTPAGAPPPADGPVAKAAITLFRRAMRPHVGWKSPEAGYPGLVAECRMALLRLSPAAQSRMVRSVLGATFAKPWGTWFYATFCGDPTLSAGFTPVAFEWLVGPARVVSPAEAAGDPPVGGGGAATTAAPGTVVKIDRCRLLAEGGCKGMCVNLCQQPTQQWFEGLGMDVTLTPDWETGGCEMAWGVKAPATQEDEAVGAPCFGGCGVAMHCGRARAGPKEEGCTLAR